MKQIVIAAIMVFSFSSSVWGQLNPGDPAYEFELLNVDGTKVSLSDYSKEKGVILVFTCNLCPFAKAYEKRIIKLHNNFGNYGYPVVAINPNDVHISPDDSMEKMKVYAKEKKYPFVYLKDNGEVYKAYGASRTPEVFLLKNNGKGKFNIVYSGAIDNNAMDEKSASEKYLFQAIASIEKGIAANPDHVKAIGCTIKASDTQ
ncbi:MAG: thioredoxin family protein [Bacteroidales bacterium]|jgi:peroxiredoxin|nr:thioredoxin family protein [Bacteroidales bacterium]